MGEGDISITQNEIMKLIQTEFSNLSLIRELFKNTKKSEWGLENFIQKYQHYHTQLKKGDKLKINVIPRHLERPNIIHPVLEASLILKNGRNYKLMELNPPILRWNSNLLYDNVGRKRLSEYFRF